MAQLYPWVLGSLFAPYDSQGYGGGVLTRFHTWLLLFEFEFELYCDRRSVGQFVLVSGPLWDGWPDYKFLWVTITFFFFSCRALWRKDGSVINILLLSKPKSRYDWRSISRSVSMSWCWAPSGFHDQMFVTVWRLLLCLCGAPSLTRGQVCRLSVRVCIFKSFVSTYMYKYSHFRCLAYKFMYIHCI
jgi:hypothetical protein